jgi:hypothetical protein
MIVLKFRTFKKKKAITPKWVMGFTSGKVDLGMLNMFAIELNLYLL